MVVKGLSHSNHEKPPQTKGASTYFWPHTLGHSVSLKKQQHITTFNTGDLKIYIFLFKSQQPILNV